MNKTYVNKVYDEIFEGDMSELEVKTKLHHKLSEKYLCTQSYGYDFYGGSSYLKTLEDEIKDLENELVQ